MDSKAIVQQLKGAVVAVVEVGAQADLLLDDAEQGVNIDHVPTVVAQEVEETAEVQTVSRPRAEGRDPKHLPREGR
eukprot:6788850-Pyramimonas_sp.AAC.1